LQTLACTRLRFPQKPELFDLRLSDRTVPWKLVCVSLTGLCSQNLLGETYRPLAYAKNTVQLLGA
jgi:hypothetical protein